MDDVSFKEIAVVSCGTLSIELNHLKKEGFLDTPYLFFTTPGLHEDVRELERQLVQRIRKAKEKQHRPSSIDNAFSFGLPKPDPAYFFADGEVRGSTGENKGRGATAFIEHIRAGLGAPGGLRGERRSPRIYT